MIRRSFFQTLAAALLPQPVITAAETKVIPRIFEIREKLEAFRGRVG